jgi:cytochrome c biogenesis protein CcmG, thiol:disulfide interchange protein DsbE
VRRLWTVGVLVLASVGLIWVFAQAFGKDVRHVPFNLAGQPAPDFELERIDGKGTLSLQSLRGKPVVINFWASWCRPCAYEHPVLEWGNKRFGNEVHFVGITFEDTLPQAKVFLRKHGESFAQLHDEQSRVAVEYGAAGVPETYFITAEGVIAGKHIGPISQQELVARIMELRGPAPSAQRTPQ